MLLATAPLGKSQGAKPLERYDTTAENAIDTESGLIENGAKVVALFDKSNQSRDAIQDTSGNRPTLVEDATIGRFLVRFTSGQYLEVASPGGSGIHFFMVVRGTVTTGTRVIVTRDTSATTTKPAYSIQLTVS